MPAVRDSVHLRMRGTLACSDTYLRYRELCVPRNPQLEPDSSSSIHTDRERRLGQYRPRLPTQQIEAPVSLIPSDGPFAQIDVYLLRFQELFDAMQAEFAAMTTLLVSAPRRFDVARLHRVYPNNSSPQGFHHAQATEDVARPDGGR